MKNLLSLLFLLSFGIMIGNPTRRKSTREPLPAKEMNKLKLKSFIAKKRIIYNQNLNENNNNTNNNNTNDNSYEPKDANTRNKKLKS